MSEYTIVTVDQQPTAAVKSDVEMAEMPNVERSARARIADVLPSLNVEPVGDNFTLCRMPRNGKKCITNRA